MPGKYSPSTGQTSLGFETSETLGPATSNPSTSYAEGSHAKTSPLLARVPASTEPGQVFGLSIGASFASYDPGTCSWRTLQLSVAGVSTVYSGKWPRAGTMRSGIVSPLSPLAPLTDAIACSSWQPLPTLGTMAARGLLPTPSASTGGRSVPAGTTMTGQTPDGRKVQVGLQTLARRGLLPTAKANADSPSMQKWAAHRNLPPGRLHPRYVEWMMGFPDGWTDLDVLETPSSLRSQNGSDAE